MVSKIEKQIVRDYLSGIDKQWEGASIKEKYESMLSIKTASNSTVLCLNCMKLRNRYKDKFNCDNEPNYDMNTMYTKILEFVK